MAPLGERPGDRFGHGELAVSDLAATGELGDDLAERCSDVVGTHAVMVTTAV